MIKRGPGRWLVFLVMLGFSLGALSCTKPLNNEVPDLGAVVCTFDNAASAFDKCTFGP